MAYSFVRTTPTYISVATAIVTAAPLTMACWFYRDSQAFDHTLISIVDTAGTANHFSLQSAGGIAGDPVRAQTRAGASSSASSTTGFSLNTWHHAAAVFTAANARAAFIDGGSKGTDSGSRTPSSLDTTGIGALVRATPVVGANGRIAEAAIWNVALTDAEIAWLGLGFSPLTLTYRLGNLVLYRDLIRELNRPGIGPAMTNSGATVGNHPRIIYPSASIIGIPTVVAPSINAEYGGFEYGSAEYGGIAAAIIPTGFAPRLWRPSKLIGLVR